MLQEPNGIIQFDGLILVALALLNSEVEMDDQIDYFLMSIEPIGIAALKLMIELNKLSFEEWLIRDRLLYFCIELGFLEFANYFNTLRLR